MKTRKSMDFRQTLIYLLVRCSCILSADTGKPPAAYDPAFDLHSKSMIGFCESEFYIPKAKTSCLHGIHFGQRPPKCVCIRGAYQMYMDNCEVADGFAEEVCTLLDDKPHGVKVKGIKLTKEVKWDQLGVVCNRIAGSTTEWDYLSVNGKARINHMTTNFYSINGKAFVTMTESKGKRSYQICVQKDTLKDIICLYRHHDNVDIWHVDTSTEITVRVTCPSSASAKPLLAYRCFNPLTLLDSDCQVPCVKTNLWGSGGYSDLDNLDGIPNLEGNCTDPKAYFTHENKFIDRQLLMFMVLDQLKKPDDPRTVSMTEPKSEGLKKAYTLFNLVRNISISSCDYPYLKRDVLDWASKFFMYLHKATKLQYELKISDGDFEWIHSILTQCQGNLTALKLSTMERDLMCSTGQKRATGYCRPPKNFNYFGTTTPADEDDDNEVETTEKSKAEEEASCDFTPVKISPLYTNYEQKHHVPEYNWLFMDIVHINCFEYFKESYRMFHILEQMYEKLFTTPIKDYWHFPRWDASTKKSMLTVDADDIMWNAQVCAQSVYHYHENKIHRLVRPRRAKYPMRRKRASELISTSNDVFCAKGKSDFKFPQGCNGETPKPAPKT